MMHIQSHRGFTLLIAVVLASVALSVGLALLDITYKQLVLATTAKQSQYAFYNADSALECALYFDQQKDYFNTNPFGLATTDVTCNGMPVTFTQVRQGSAPTVSTFTIPCSGGGTSAAVTVYKNDTGTYVNSLFTTGYNTCDTSSPRRVERGLKALY